LAAAPPARMLKRGISRIVERSPGRSWWSVDRASRAKSGYGQTIWHPAQPQPQVCARSAATILIWRVVHATIRCHGPHPSPRALPRSFPHVGLPTPLLATHPTPLHRRNGKNKPTSPDATHTPKPCDSLPGGRIASGLDEATPDRVPGQLDPVAHPELSRMFARWRSTVFLLITSVSAISSLVCPSAISLTTSCSRGVSGSSGTLSPLRARSR
jgi:hypothetical protein